MSNWRNFDFRNRLCAILASVAPSNPNHHLGAPFLTAYQIAIEFNERHPADVEKLGLHVGGKGTGVHASLAQYIARELSQSILRGELPDIEGAFLSSHRVVSLAFTNDVESSAEGGAVLSMFRLKPKPTGSGVAP